MRCPFCGNEDTQVKDSRPAEDNSAIRRRRQCPNCGARFTTFERVQLRELTVLKSNDKRETFDRDKLLRSMTIALRKRPVDPDRVERVVNGIVRRLESSGESEIPTKLIGERGIGPGDPDIAQQAIVERGQMAALLVPLLPDQQGLHDRER